MIEFHRWTVYREENGKFGLTHLVVGGGLVLQCCGKWHEQEEKCDTADDWTLVRSMPSAVS